MSGGEVDRGRGFRPIKEAASAADYLNLANTLRKWLVVERRKTDPLCHQRQPVLKEEGVFGFLRITQAAIAIVKLPRVLLLAYHQAGRFREKLLQVVVLHRRLLIELNY